MRGLGTDHVISGPIRGLENKCIPWRNQTNKQTDGHRDSMTKSAHCAVSVKISYLKCPTLFVDGIMCLKGV